MQTESFRSQSAPKAGALQVQNVRFIRLPEVRDVTGLSRSQLYRLVQSGDFPAQVKLGASASAWIEAEVMNWCADRIAASRAAAA
ncbi:MAG: AlpA family phage regulatory protein [Rhodanobacter sp.]